jgi:hypothetical protein
VQADDGGTPRIEVLGAEVLAQIRQELEQS